MQTHESWINIKKKQIAIELNNLHKDIYFYNMHKLLWKKNGIQIVIHNSANKFKIIILIFETFKFSNKIKKENYYKHKKFKKYYINIYNPFVIISKRYKWKDDVSEKGEYNEK